MRGSYSGWLIIANVIGDWQALDRDSVGVTSDGNIRLARAIEPVKDVDANVIWALLRDGDGVLAATGDSGKLYRIEKNGTVNEVGKVLEPEITALGRDANGKRLRSALDRLLAQMAKK